jgi:acetyltransferase
VIDSVLAERRKVLTEMESKTLLSSFHIPVTQTLLRTHAQRGDDDRDPARLPVALKIDSPDISHKSDVQGVALNIMSGASVRDTYDDMVERVSGLRRRAHQRRDRARRWRGARRGREVHVGLVTDQPFGPVIVFGAGGTMIELHATTARWSCRRSYQFLARQLIGRSRVAETWARGAAPNAVDMDGARAAAAARLGVLVCELPRAARNGHQPHHRRCLGREWRSTRAS